jgi:hypothetical protein
MKRVKPTYLMKKCNLSSKNTELLQYTDTWRVQTRHLHCKKKLAHLNNSCRSNLCTRYPVLTALLLEIQVFCDVTPSRLVNIYRRCLHLQRSSPRPVDTASHRRRLQLSPSCNTAHLPCNYITSVFTLHNFILQNLILYWKKLIFRILMF